MCEIYKFRTYQIAVDFIENDCARTPVTNTGHITNGDVTVVAGVPKNCHKE